MDANWRNSPECRRANTEGRRAFWAGEPNPVKCICKYDPVDDWVEHAGFIMGYLEAEGTWAEGNPEEQVRRTERRRERTARHESVNRCLARLDKAMPMGRTEDLVFGGTPEQST